MKAMRILASFLLVLLPSGAFAAPDDPPEIRIRFSPAWGYLPIEGRTERVYQFDVSARGETPKGPGGLIGTQMLLTPGHTREVYREFGDFRLEGRVKVDEAGQLMYRIVLFRKGVRVASASSSVAWTAGSPIVEIPPAPR